MTEVQSPVTPQALTSCLFWPLINQYSPEFSACSNKMKQRPIVCVSTRSLVFQTWGVRLPPLPTCCLQMQWQLGPESAVRTRQLRGQDTHTPLVPSSAWKLCCWEKYAQPNISVNNKRVLWRPNWWKSWAWFSFSLKCTLLQKQVTVLYWWNNLTVSFTVCCCHDWPIKSCSPPLLPRGAPQGHTGKSEWSINDEIGQLANNNKLLCSSHSKDASSGCSLCLETEDGNPGQN